jgi:Protein of unknown function (DUF1254)
MSSGYFFMEHSRACAYCYADFRLKKWLHSRNLKFRLSNSPRSSSLSTLLVACREAPSIDANSDCVISGRTDPSPWVDLLYSAAWFDVRKEPVVITVPASPGLYYSVQFMEMYSDIFAYFGTRATGGKAGRHLLVSHDWNGEKPAGIDSVIRAPNVTGLLLFAHRHTRPQGADRIAQGAGWRGHCAAFQMATRPNRARDRARRDRSSASNKYATLFY